MRGLGRIHRPLRAPEPFDPRSRGPDAGDAALPKYVSQFAFRASTLAPVRKNHIRAQHNQRLEREEWCDIQAPFGTTTKIRERRSRLGKDAQQEKIGVFDR